MWSLHNCYTWQTFYVNLCYDSTRIAIVDSNLEWHSLQELAKEVISPAHPIDASIKRVGYKSRLFISTAEHLLGHWNARAGIAETNVACWARRKQHLLTQHFLAHTSVFFCFLFQDHNVGFLWQSSPLHFQWHRPRFFPCGYWTATNRSQFHTWSGGFIFWIWGWK